MSEEMFSLAPPSRSELRSLIGRNILAHMSLRIPGTFPGEEVI